MIYVFTKCQSIKRRNITKNNIIGTEETIRNVISEQN